MTVRFAPTAEAKLLSAVAYLLDENPSAAWTFHDRALEATFRLHDYPQSGRVIPEFPTLPYREVIAPPYRFFYRVVGEEVWIVDVWHDAQIPSAPGSDL
jgi:plasmid stabilization system protein ParE